MKLIFLLSLMLSLQSKDVWSYIYLNRKVNGCYGIYCNNNGTLDEYANCTCVCAAGFTGHFCGTEMRPSSFPRGQYALPPTLGGCPEDTDAYGWKTGYINMTMVDSNVSRHYWSDVIHVLGPYHRRTVQLNFCSRSDNANSSDEQELLDVWPSGSYCVYKVGKSCPQDFEDGFIHLEDYTVPRGMYGGMLPEINFTTNAGVMLFFCCHYGNNSDNEVTLGDDSSQFFLFKGTDAEICPQVAGMKYLEENFAFRKYGNSTWSTSGSVPFHEEDDEFFNITFCFFKPKVGQQCMFEIDNGSSYRGNHSKGKGKECDNWTSVASIDSRYAVDLEENYCRRLFTKSEHPICFVNRKIRACKDIPFCDDSITRMENVAYYKRVDSSSGFQYKPNEAPLSEVETLLNQQLVVNGIFGSDEDVNFRIGTPVIEPYFKVDLGFSHDIYGVLIYRRTRQTEPDTYWQRMVLWISRDEWDFLTFGAYMCGDMVNTYKNDRFLFACQRPVKGRYVTLQTNVYSDPDTVADTSLNLQLNEIIIYGKATKCGKLLGLMTGEVTASQITTSSYEEGFHGNQSRLNENGPGWCPDILDSQPVIQVHMLLPILVEGVIIQGWIHIDDTLKYTRSFKVLHGLSYRSTVYYKDNTGETKLFYTSTSKQENFTQTFWFSKPFVARVVGIELPIEEVSCLKIEWIVCRKEIERDCAHQRSAGWQSTENIEVINDVPYEKQTPLVYNTCFSECRNKLTCEVFEHNKLTRVCRLMDLKHYPPFITYNFTGNLRKTITQKLCFKESEPFRHQIFSSEAIITSPNYPYYYGSHTEYTCEFYLADAVAFKVDILDVNLHSKAGTQVKYFSSGECHDRLAFYFDINSNKSDTIQHITSEKTQIQYKGSRLIGSQNNRLLIKFKSCDASRTMPFKGFVIKVATSDCPGCIASRDCPTPCGYIQSLAFPSGMFNTSGITNVYKIKGSNYEYVKLHIVHCDLPKDTDDAIAFVEISPDGVETTVSVPRPPELYPIYYSQTSNIKVRTVSVVDSVKTGYQLRYNLIKMKRWNDSIYQMNTSECETDWMYFEGSCYLFSRFYKGTFMDAQRECAIHDADLAIISSIEESNAINFYLLENIEYLQSTVVVFGLRSFVKDKEFTWIDGSRADFQNWYTNWTNVQETQPEMLTIDACVVIRVSSSRHSANWVHQPCGTDYTHAICEKRLGKKENSVNNTEHGKDTMHYDFGKDKRKLKKPVFDCNDGSLIDSTSKCDRQIQCVDISDELNCDYPNTSCGSHEFECENQQCIPISRYCDYLIDCEDETDENACIHPECKDTEFRCSNGECVPLSDRCDIKEDCLDASDELDCKNVDCSHDGKLFKCADESTCIPQSKVCDGFVDCPGLIKSDESDCHHVLTRRTCKEWYADGFRQSGTYIIKPRKVSFRVECEFDETSEVLSTVMHHAHEGSIPYKEEFSFYRIIYNTGFQSEISLEENIVDVMESLGMRCAQQVEVECYHIQDIDGGVRIFGYRGTSLSGCRVYTPDCVDRRGVSLCNKTECKCRLTQADWLQKPRDVWYKDTFIIDDTKFLPVKLLRLRGATYPAQLRITLGPLVCNTTLTGSQENIKCNNGKAVPLGARCLYSIDRYGSVTGCRDNTHLLNCETFRCPEGFAKCPNSYCIPLSYICDDRIDCRLGEDEMSCDTWNCPNQYRCRNSKTCIPRGQVCNGWKDCPMGDDESLCETTCPLMCTCTGRVIDCSMISSSINSLNEFPKDTRKLYLNNNVVYFGKDINHRYFFQDFVHLGELSLVRCEISEVPDQIFSNLKNLYNLDLSFNKITRISRQTFLGLENLKTIKLTGNTLISVIETGAFNPLKNITSLDLSELSLSKIDANTFQGMVSLRFLNISNNKIDTMVDNAFYGLRNLYILDMQQNIISAVEKDSLAGLTSLSLLYTDSFMFCCIKPNSVDKENCFPAPDEFSSCADLMRNEALRVLVWIVGIFAFFGNISSFIFRFVSERDTLMYGYGILVTNLSAADMLMGVYLLMISIADASYRGRYAWNDITWRKSSACSTAGVLAIVSVECSVLILILITFDRFKSIRFQSGLTARDAISCCVTVWVVAGMIAIIPILPVEQLQEYFGDSYYSVSGVCLVLPLTRKRLSGWGYSASVLIIFNFLCFVCIAVGQSIIYLTVIKTKIMLESPDRRIEFQVARRLSPIVITNFLAWCPICALGVNALNGGTVSVDVYTWIAVFVMPLNSTLNPVIYTCSTFSNTKLGRRILTFLGFQTVRFSSQNQVSAHLQNVHKIYRMRTLVLKRQKNHIPLKEYITSSDDVSLTTLVIVTGRLAYILDNLHDMDIMVSRFANETVLIKLGSNQNITELVIKALPRESKSAAEKSININDFGHVVGWLLKRYNVQKQKKNRPGASTS